MYVISFFQFDIKNISASDTKLDFPKEKKSEPTPGIPT